MIGRFNARGLTYTVHLLDDLEVLSDPTVLVFREDESVAIATVHLNPEAECLGPDNESHVVVREDPSE